MSFDYDITVVGAGLAGCEAAWQAARYGARVRLIEMKPDVRSAAHKSNDFAELVCSNSLGALGVESARGLLKQEMRELGSVLVECADKHRVPAGGALAVDRDGFSRAVTEKLLSCENIRVVRAEVTEIPKERPCVIATGPLTAARLSENIAGRLGADNLYFFDAAAPIVNIGTVDETRTFRASRYGKGDTDGNPSFSAGYINCPFSCVEYGLFVRELIAAEVAKQHGFEDTRLFEGCMPIENLAKRGLDTLRFGPLKPVGLRDPSSGRVPYAVVQLRQDDTAGELYNLVGFQTRLTYPEQRRVFRMIPGLLNAEFARYGVMHRNTYIESPRVLNAGYSVRGDPGLFFAGQLTGVEGYMESAASGLIAGLGALMRVRGGADLHETPKLPTETLIGALAGYVAAERQGSGVGTFSPMNANFGLLPPVVDVCVEQTVHNDVRRKKLSKRERNALYAERSLNIVRDYVKEVERYVDTRQNK